MTVKRLPFLDELNALDNLIAARRALPAPVDDDWEEARHRYECAKRAFLKEVMS